MSNLTVASLTGPASQSGRIGLNPGSFVSSPGTPIQVARLDWTTATTTSSSTYVDASGSSITFTPKIATSKLLIVAELAMAPYYPGASYAGMAARIVRDGTVISVQGAEHEVYLSAGTDLYTRTVKSVYANANSTNPTTFKIQIAGYAATNQARLNQAGNWNSCITIWEIAQ